MNNLNFLSKICVFTHHMALGTPLATEPFKLDVILLRTLLHTSNDTDNLQRVYH